MRFRHILVNENRICRPSFGSGAPLTRPAAQRPIVFPLSNTWPMWGGRPRPRPAPPPGLLPYATTLLSARPAGPGGPAQAGGPAPQKGLRLSSPSKTIWHQASGLQRSNNRTHGLRTRCFSPSEIQHRSRPVLFQAKQYVKLSREPFWMVLAPIGLAIKGVCMPMGGRSKAQPATSGQLTHRRSFKLQNSDW